VLGARSLRRSTDKDLAEDTTGALNQRALQVVDRVQQKLTGSSHLPVWCDDRG
jgi:hypothetical protein